MGSRCAALLVLMAAASAGLGFPGPKEEEEEEVLLPGWQSHGTVSQSAFPGGKEPLGSLWTTLASSRMSVSPTQLDPSMATTPLPAASDATMTMPIEPTSLGNTRVPVDTEQRTVLSSRATGTSEGTTLGILGQSHPAPSLWTGSFPGLFPTATWPPSPTTPVGAAAQRSSPPPAYKELPTSGAGKTNTVGLQPARLPQFGSWSPEITEPPMADLLHTRTDSDSPAPSRNQISSTIATEETESWPSETNGPELWEAKSPCPEIGATLGYSPEQLLPETPRPLTPSADVVWERDVDATSTQHFPHGRSTGASLAGPTGLTDQPRVSARREESQQALDQQQPGTGLPESWSAVRFFGLSPALQASSAPSESPVGLNRVGEVARRLDVADDSFVSPAAFALSKGSQLPRTEAAWTGPLPTQEALPFSTGSPAQPANWTEEASHSPDSDLRLGTSLPQSLSPTSHPLPSTLAPESYLPTSSGRPGDPPEASTEELGPLGAELQPRLMKGTPPLLTTSELGALALTSEIAMGPLGPPESHSMWPVTEGSPAHSVSLSPGQTAGDVLSRFSTSPAEDPASDGGRVKTLLATRESPRATSPPTEMAGPGQTFWEAVTRALERGDSIAWTPSLASAREGGSLKGASSGCLEGHSQTAMFSGHLDDGMAVSRSKEEEARVPGSLLVTHLLQTSPTRDGQAEREASPASPVSKAAQTPHNLETGQTTPTSAGPLGSTWHPWTSVAQTWVLLPRHEEVTVESETAMPRNSRTGAQTVFVVENQPPFLKATLLHIPCELVLAMEFSRSFRNPQSPEYQSLVLSINQTVTPLFAPLPGFLRLEVKAVRPGSLVVEFDALFLAGTPGLWAALNHSSLSERLAPGLCVANASVLKSKTLEQHLDLCALLFSCPAGYECIAGQDGGATCVSVCHRDYCKNGGICTHAANHTPVCQCPVGSDFWFLGMRCDYKVTQQALLGVACGLLLSLMVVGVAVAGLVIRRVRMLLLEARADQTQSSYRRFCRLDDVSAHYWSEPWLASASSLDNPAFNNSEELLHLQILDTTSYQDDGTVPNSFCKLSQDAPCGRPNAPCNWDVSSNSVNDAMVDSGKASEVSVSSWPMEPAQWSPFPFPALHTLSRQRAQKGQMPQTYDEGAELVTLERSWTA